MTPSKFKYNCVNKVALISEKEKAYLYGGKSSFREHTGTILIYSILPRQLIKVPPHSTVYGESQGTGIYPESGKCQGSAETHQELKTLRRVTDEAWELPRAGIDIYSVIICSGPREFGNSDRISSISIAVCTVKSLLRRRTFCWSIVILEIHTTQKPCTFLCPSTLVKATQPT